MKERAIHNICLQVIAISVLFMLSCCTVPKSVADNATMDIVQYSIKPPEGVSPGHEFAVAVSFSVQPNWYIYAPTGNNAALGMVEANVVFVPQKGMAKKGALKVPDAQFKNGHEVYTGNSIKMQQDFKADANAQPDIYNIEVKITWQTCNDHICLPPVTETKTINIKVE